MQMMKWVCGSRLCDRHLCSFQIDVFEQQLRSISKIDFMERFLSEVKTSDDGKEKQIRTALE